MNIAFSSSDKIQHSCESATHPIEPLATCQGSLLLLADISLRRRLAYPATPPAAHSGVSN